MAEPYSKETQAILNDFLQTLGQRGDVDPDLLVELRRLTDRGELGNRSRIRQVVAELKVKADELENRHHQGP